MAIVNDEQGMRSPVFLLVNRKSGSGNSDQLIKTARALCSEQNRELKICTPEPEGDFMQTVTDFCHWAQEQNGIVIASGGDGTIQAAAQILMHSDTPLAPVPCGTFNYFARNLGFSLNPEAALKQALEGTPRKVPLGKLNDQIFIINASVGLYSYLIRERERYSRWFGRHRLVALITTLFSLFKGYKPLHLQLETQERDESRTTPLVFVGINALQINSVADGAAQCLKEQKMAVIVMKPVTRLGLVRLCLRGLMRRLGDDDAVELFCTRKMVLNPDGRHRQSVVIDGERQRMDTPLEFELLPEALTVITPGSDKQQTGE